jgi:hypothetical protein
MKNFLIPVVIISLSASQALAANPPPLEPGKPAGVGQAQLGDGTTMMAIAGAALVGIGIALATAGNGSSGPATSTTSTTP